MNISVISPGFRNTGNTTLAILTGLELAQRGKQVCLTHVNFLSSSFFNYMNLLLYEDRTTTPSQIVKLIREGALNPDDIHDYCRQVTDNLEVFSNNSRALTSEDMKLMLDYICTTFPHEFKVLDVDIDTNNLSANKHVQEVLKYSDAVIINLNPSVEQLNYFRSNGKELLDIIGGNKIIIVINKYNDIVYSLKEIIEIAGIKKLGKNLVVLRYNPWIEWGTNHAKIAEIYKKIAIRDKRVIDVSKDLSSLGSKIVKIRTLLDKMAGGKK